jgi:hypothetical protein
MNKGELIDLLLRHLKIASSSGSEVVYPVELDLDNQSFLSLRIYMWTVTRQYGGRPQDEYKMQVILPGQKAGERASVDFSGGRMPMLLGYSPDFECWVIWDETCYEDFAYSRNMQVKEDTLSQTYTTQIARQSRIVRQGGMRIQETILACQPQHLSDALYLRSITVGREIYET